MMEKERERWKHRWTEMQRKNVNSKKEKEKSLRVKLQKGRLTLRVKKVTSKREKAENKTYRNCRNEKLQREKRDTDNIPKEGRRMNETD